MKRKPNILLFFDWFYPDLSAGGPVRSFINLIEQTKNDINWHVVCSNTNYSTKIFNPNLPINTWEKLPFGGKAMYLPLKAGSKELKKILKAKKWHCVYINSMYSSFFGFQALVMAKKLSLRVVLCPRGMLAEGSVKQKAWLKLPYLWLSKWLGWYNNIVWHATNQQEKKQIIKRYGSQVEITVVPNLVRKIKPGNRLRSKKKGSLRILSVARVAPEKNLDYIIQRLKDLSLPDISLTIIGSVHNPKYAQKLQAMAQHSHISLTLVGHLEPEAIQEQILSHDLFVLPTLGENFGHAIIESLGAGLPVLISDKTPWEGLFEVQAGKAIPLSNVMEFYTMLNQFYQMDETIWQNWHKGAINYAKSYVKQQTIIKSYLELFRATT